MLIGKGGIVQSCVQMGFASIENQDFAWLHFGQSPWNRTCCRSIINPAGAIVVIGTDTSCRHRVCPQSVHTKCG